MMSNMRSSIIQAQILTATLETLDAGVGLGALILCLLAAFGSTRLCLLLPAETILDGLGFAIAPFACAFARFAGFGGDGSSNVTAAGRTNIPRPVGQWKYRWPCTAPSFFPEVSSSSTPIHSPVAKCVLPTNRTTAGRPSESSMV